MPLESASYVTQLNPAWPLHTDGFNQMDSQLRLLKTVIQTSFPNIAAAVTASASDLNYATGLPAVINGLMPYTGGTFTGPISGTTGTFSGAVGVGSLSTTGTLASGSATITGTLTASGALAGASCTVAGVLVGGTLVIGGAAAIGSLAVGGALSANSLSVTAGLAVGGTLTGSTLALTGLAQINGVSVGAAGTYNYIFDTGSQGVGVRAGTSGSSQSWTFASNGQFQTGGLAVAGAAVLASSLQVNGAASLDGGLFVSGVNYSGYASGWNMSSTGTSALAQNVTASANLGTGCISPYFFATSDARLKLDVETITDEMGEDFVNFSRPVTYIKDGAPSAGFIAQEQDRCGFAVIRFPHPGLPETIDDDGYVSPADFALHIDYDSRVAFLTAALKAVMLRLARAEARLGIR